MQDNNIGHAWKRLVMTMSLTLEDIISVRTPILSTSLNVCNLLSKYFHFDIDILFFFTFLFTLFNNSPVSVQPV